MAADEADAGMGGPLEKAKDLLQKFGMMKADEAKALLQEAQESARANGDKDEEVAALRVLVDMALARKDYTEALRVAEQAVDVNQDKSKKAKSMCLVAEIQLSQGANLFDATSMFEKALAVYKEAQDSAGAAGVLGQISQVKLEADDTEEALRIARQAISTESSAAHIGMLTVAQIHLGRGDPSAAIEQATEMLTTCKDSGNKAGQASASLVMANALLSLDEASMEGIQCGKDALAVFQELGDVYGGGSVLHTLAHGYFAHGDLEEGLKCAREALSCFRQTGDRANEEMLKEAIEEARVATQEMRKTMPKRPFVLPPSATAPTPCGPLKCAVEQTVPQEYLDVAVSGRKYWGTPTQVQHDPSIDAVERAPNHTIIFGMFMSDTSPSQACIELNDLVCLMAKGEIAKIPIAVMTKGVFGRLTGSMCPASMSSLSAATIWGLVRTARQEVPSVIMQLLDFSDTLTTAEIPRCIRAPVGESSFYHQARWEPQLAAVPSLLRRELRRDNLTAGGGEGAKDPEKTAKFSRKSFNWVGPNHKIDFAWYRQEWRAVGPMMADVGPMPPPPPCRAMRTC